MRHILGAFVKDAVGVGGQGLNELCLLAPNARDRCVPMAAVPNAWAATTAEERGTARTATEASRTTESTASAIVCGSASKRGSKSGFIFQLTVSMEQVILQVDHRNKSIATMLRQIRT
jgi:hypothetical protein